VNKPERGSQLKGETRCRPCDVAGVVVSIDRTDDRALIELAEHGPDGWHYNHRTFREYRERSGLGRRRRDDDQRGQLLGSDRRELRRIERSRSTMYQCKLPPQAS
jgi:hypothetical protein